MRDADLEKGQTWGKANPAPQSLVELNNARDALIGAADLCTAIEMMACGEGDRSAPYEAVAGFLSSKLKSALEHIDSAYAARTKEAVA